MERILDGWSRFSLLEKEGDWVRLNKKQQLAGSNEKVLAVKFLNRRVLNVDAIGRTFRAAWKTRKGFDIQQVGDHLFLFFFELANDAKRVLSDEPWSFDKHLVLFHHLEGSCFVRSMSFTTIKFWAQLHGLPVNRLDIPMAIQIGKSIGVVSCHGCEVEMIVGDFLRVRVEVDVSKPLYRGRRVVLDNDEEVWVSFCYEKLPNFCYWCGMVCHDDNDCDIWLSSKGTLSIESQEFGAWMRASPFNLSQKTFCSVPGLEVFPTKGPVQEHREEEPSA